LKGEDAGNEVSLRSGAWGFGIPRIIDTHIFLLAAVISREAFMIRSLRSWCSSSSVRKVSNMGMNGDTFPSCGFSTPSWFLLTPSIWACLLAMALAIRSLVTYLCDSSLVVLRFMEGVTDRSSVAVQKKSPKLAPQHLKTQTPNSRVLTSFASKPPIY
jgi:hypothetical protein